MSQDAVNVTTPVGRIVWGDLYDPQTKNYDGKPLVVMTGPQAGQPRSDYPFGLAIPKGTERHWAETEWGAKIWAVGHASFPTQAQRPDFAWKVVDGDSNVPNKKGRKPCDQEGFKGHWVVRFGSGFAPKCFTLIGQPPGKPASLTEKDAIVPGYFVQVNFNVAGNGNQNNAGVYINHSMVCLIAYGPIIFNGPDPESAGFGVNAAIPAMASLTPPAAFAPPATPAPSATVAPVAPPPATAVPAIPVQPHPAILNAVPPPPAAAPPAPAAPVHRMTAKAAGMTYEAYIAAGWTDALLVAHGMMEA